MTNNKIKAGALLHISPNVVAVELEQLKDQRNRVGNVHIAGGVVIKLAGQWVKREKYMSAEYQATVVDKDGPVDLRISPEADQDAFVSSHLTMTHGEETWTGAEYRERPMPEWVQRALGHIGVEPYVVPEETR